MGPVLIRLRVLVALGIGVLLGSLLPASHAQIGIIGQGRLPTGCTNDQVAVWNTSTTKWDCGTGGGSPGGDPGDLQYNNAGAFGGFGDWDGSTLTVPGTVIATAGALATELTTKGYIDAAIAGIPIDSGTGGGTATGGAFATEGCQVVWLTGLQFSMSACTYTVQGVQYSATEQTVTLDAADPSNPRFDVIGVDDTGTIFELAGTPAADPSVPTVDPGSQLALATVLVPATATEPAGVSSELLYDDNAGSPAEWDWTTSGSGIVVNSTNDPKAPSTTSMEATDMASGAYAQGQIGSGTFDPNSSLLLVLYIKSKSAWGGNRGLTIGLYSAGVLVGNTVAINRSGTWGFDSSSTADYQQIAIPTTTFGVPGGETITQVRITRFGSGSGVGFFLDDVSFQGGTVVAQPTARTLSSLTAATGANTIASGDHKQAWNWALTTAGTAFTFGETTAASTSGGTINTANIVSIQTLANSTARNLYILNESSSDSLRIDDVASDTTPLRVDPTGRLSVQTSGTLDSPFTVTTPTTGRIAKFVGDTGQTFAIEGNSNAVEIGTTTDSDLQFQQNGNLRMWIDRTNEILQYYRSTVPTSVAAGNYHLKIGRNVGAVNGYWLIGLGFMFDGEMPPAYIGYQEISATDRTNGDLVFGTRSGTDASAPTERFRIQADGTFTVGGTDAVSVSTCTTFTNGLCTAGSDDLPTVADLLARIEYLEAALSLRAGGRP